MQSNLKLKNAEDIWDLRLAQMYAPNLDNLLLLKLAFDKIFSPSNFSAFSNF